MSANAPILSAHSWSYGNLTLDQVFEQVATAGYSGLDLGSGELGRNHGLEVAAVLANRSFASDVAKLADSHGLRLNDYFAWLPNDVNAESKEARAENNQVFRDLVPVLAAAGIHGVTLSPGGYLQDRWNESFQTSVKALSDLVEIAGGRLDVRIEAHVESVTDTPERTAAMVRAVPGLSLTHDYSHYVVQGFGDLEIEPLTEFATHIHIRQAREGVLAERVDEGTIDVRRLLQRLLDQGYSGGLTVEYVSSPWRNQDQVDSAAENAAMFAQVKSLLEELNRTRT
jgi:sugar phosphate isomerase/epimerase